MLGGGRMIKKWIITCRGDDGDYFEAEISAESITLVDDNTIIVDGITEKFNYGLISIEYMKRKQENKIVNDGTKPITWQSSH